MLEIKVDQPLGLMTVGLEGTTVTVTCPVALVIFLTASA